MPRRIQTAYRIISTIGEHIVARNALAGGGKCVGIDESADLRIEIAGLEIVQLRLLGSRLANEAKNGRFSKASRTPFLYLIIRKIRLICNMENGRFVDFYISETNAGDLG